MIDTAMIIFFAVALAGMALSALFSGMETGLYTLNRVRLAVRVSQQESAALRLRKYLNNPNRMLATLLIGNNIANYAGSYGVAGILNGAGFSPVQAIVINASILIPLLFVFGETLPKDLFRTHTDRWSYRLSGFLVGADRLLTVIGLAPLVRGFGWMLERLARAEQLGMATARQRISQLIKEGQGAGVLSEVQSTLVDRALAMHDRNVGMEMVPWRQVATIREDDQPDARTAKLRRHNFSRVPVVAASGEVNGVVSTLDVVLTPDCPTSELMQPTLTFTPQTPVLEALNTMRRQRMSLAIVDAAKPGGAPQGIVTLKDLVEPLTGELGAW